MHVLPDAGGIFDQEEQTIERLLAVYQHLEDWRKIEMDKAASSSKTEGQ